MKSLLAASAISVALLAAPASAQRLSPTAVAVVDTDRISRECTACRAAQTQLQTQGTTLRTRAQTLQTQLQTSGQPIQTAVNALNGKQPDAALQGRITAFQAQQRNAAQEIERSEQNFRSIQANVSRQISERLIPIINTVSGTRGASVTVDRGAVLFAAPTLDITNDVLAQLNQQLPSVSVTPLPAAPQAARPQGR
jgi:Skp family chaperone for outer membrane proteins